jgi:hypothetical protein
VKERRAKGGRRQIRNNTEVCREVRIESCDNRTIRALLCLALSLSLAKARFLSVSGVSVIACDVFSLYYFLYVYTRMNWTAHVFSSNIEKSRITWRQWHPLSGVSIDPPDVTVLPQSGDLATSMKCGTESKSSSEFRIWYFYVTWIPVSNEDLNTNSIRHPVNTSARLAWDGRELVYKWRVITGVRKSKSDTRGGCVISPANINT